jgi:hypothetical protein
MAQSDLSVLIDGIMSIGTHNTVHRIVCYRLTAENKPEPAVELIIPAASLSAFIGALSRLSDGTSPAAPSAGAATPAAPRATPIGVGARLKKGPL